MADATLEIVRTPGFVIRCRPVGLFDRSNGEC